MRSTRAGGLARRRAGGLVAVWVAATVSTGASVGCRDTGGRFPAKIEVEGRRLDRFSVTEVPLGVLAVYAPPGDHPTTADLTVGVIRSRTSVQKTVREISMAHERTVRRSYVDMPLETGSAVRLQHCRVYLDAIGQPTMALEVAERVTSESAVATTIVRELDNLEQARRGYGLCKDARETLGRVWQVHRRFYTPVR